jgi:hypothetical protein
MFYEIIKFMEKYRIKEPKTLKKLLWLDTFLGNATGWLGLLGADWWSKWFGLSPNFLIFISSVTLVYAVFAFWIARQPTTPIGWTRLLIAANWVWAIFSIGLVAAHFSEAQELGKIFLILQIVVVGGLAYLESWQIIRI